MYVDFNREVRGHQPSTGEPVITCLLQNELGVFCELRRRDAGRPIVATPVPYWSFDRDSYHRLSSTRPYPLITPLWRKIHYNASLPDDNNKTVRT